MEFEGLKRLVADMLFDKGAVLDRRRSFQGRPVKEGERPDGLGFRLKLHEKQPQAPPAPYYFNFRTADNPNPGPLDAQDMLFIGIVMCLRAIDAGLQYDAVAGIPYAGDPIADAFAHSVHALKHKQVPVLRLVKEETAEGRRVVGVREYLLSVTGSSRVLPIDDLCTKANSKLEAIDVLWASNHQVTDVLVLVDQGRGGAEELLRRGYRLHAVFTSRWLFQYYQATGAILRGALEEILAYLNSDGRPKPAW